jgi:hypothetical protein
MEEGLEASFANMMQQHAHHSAHLRDRVQTSKKAALEAAAVVSDLLVESINGGVQEVFVNEKQIEMEARSMGVTVQRFSKQTSQWLNVIHTFDSALKVSSTQFLLLPFVFLFLLSLSLFLPPLVCVLSVAK